ncbi:hypothetical protein [Liquorilactobacillus hordei]|uniref:hypothetical protein n=1 Tax=Liquorilactobacillus hordei TaxID=468911 RepID=UPI0039E79AEC
MAKIIQGTDGKKYKKIEPETNRKRTAEIVMGAISLIISVLLIGSGLGMASLADAWGGGGIYTTKFIFGILLAVLAFILCFFINKNRKLIGWVILAIGIYIGGFCGVYGIAGGILFIITGVLALLRK